MNFNNMLFSFLFQATTINRIINTVFIYWFPVINKQLLAPVTHVPPTALIGENHWSLRAMRDGGKTAGKVNLNTVGGMSAGFPPPQVF